MATSVGTIQRLKDKILAVWMFEKQLKQVVETTAKEIEEITEEMDQLDGLDYFRWSDMLESAKESNNRAEQQLKQVVLRHKALRDEYNKLVNNA